MVKVRVSDGAEFFPGLLVKHYYRPAAHSGSGTVHYVVVEELPVLLGSESLGSSLGLPRILPLGHLVNSHGLAFH